MSSATTDVLGSMSDKAKETSSKQYQASGMPTLAFWFWFLTGIKTPIIFLFFQDNPQQGTLFSGLISAVLVVMLGFAWYARRVHVKSQSPIAGKIIFVFLTWAGLTLFWTQADSTFTALAYWLLMASEVLAVYMLLRMGPVDETGGKSLQGIALSAVVVAFVALFLGGLSGYGRLGNEEFFHPNVIGNQMAIATLCSIYLAFSNRRKQVGASLWIVVTGLLMITLFATLSKTSIIALGLALPVFIFQSRIRIGRRLALMLLIIVVVASSYTSTATYLNYYVNVEQSGLSLDTLSGRTVIWEQTWATIKERPLLGYGFMSYRDVGPQIIRLRLVEAHNEWLNVWFNLGAVGVVLAAALYSAYLITVLRSTWNVPNRQQAGLGLALILYALVRGLTEGNMTSLVYPLPLMLLMLAWMSQASNKIGGAGTE